MAKLKSTYVSAFVAFVYAAMFIAVYQLYVHRSAGLSAPWLSLLFTVAPIALFFLRLFVAPIARTSANLTPLLFIGSLGCAITGYFCFASGVKQPLAFVLAVLGGVVGLYLYVFWYSRFDDRRGNAVLRVGSPLPEFTLEDPQGRAVVSSSFLGSPALLIFYRGNWCPLCMAQIKEVARLYQELSKQGVNVALVSSQSHENSEKLAKKFNVPFMFLVDKDNRTAKKLNIFSANGTPAGLGILGYEADTAMPTVVITDTKGIIVFADLTDNYRVRPEPEVFLQVLKEHSVIS